MLPINAVHTHYAIMYNKTMYIVTLDAISLIKHTPILQLILYYYKCACLQIQNPELVARLEKIKARLAHQEYDRMVQNLSPSSQV